MTARFPRETDEPYPVPILDHDTGALITSGVAFSVVPQGARPGTWVAAVIADGATCVEIVSLAPGYWNIYSKLTLAPWAPVVDCGTIQIT
jgi:hypothetical protein